MESQYNPGMPIEDRGQTWYTVKEAAELLGMTKQAVFDYVKRYSLETRDIYGAKAISFASIAWIKKHNENVTKA